MKVLWLLHYCLLDAIHDVVNILIGDHRAGRKAEANLEEFLLDAVRIDRR